MCIRKALTDFSPCLAFVTYDFGGPNEISLRGGSYNGLSFLE